MQLSAPSQPSDRLVNFCNVRNFGQLAVAQLKQQIPQYECLYFLTVCLHQVTNAGSENTRVTRCWVLASLRLAFKLTTVKVAKKVAQIVSGKWIRCIIQPPNPFARPYMLPDTKNDQGRHASAALALLLVDQAVSEL